MTFKLFLPLLFLAGSIALAIYEYNHPPSELSEYYHKGLEAFKDKDFESAEYYFNMAVFENDQDALSLFYLGLSKLQQGEFEEAISDCKKATEMDKSLEKMYYNFNIEEYENYTSDGNLPDNKIESDYTDEVEYAEDASTYNSLGLEEYNSSNYKLAIPYFESAIEVDKNFKYAYYNLALCYYYLGNLDESIKYYTNAIDVDPEYLDAYFDRGFCRYEKGDYQGAVEDYTAYIELDNSEPSAYQNRGLAYSYLGNTTEACADWETAKSLDGDVDNLIEQYCN